jgi:ribosomal protein S18 acetylase RimI-like enzyme
MQRSPLPDDVALRVWRPDEPGGFDPLRLAVQAQHALGLFEDDRFTEIGIWSGTRRIHRLIVTPRWHRFPFMAPGDLQIGALWTHPRWRRRGLASFAIDHAHRFFAAPGQRFWYVTESANAASIALSQSSGYRFVGEGRRTKPIGISMLGQFRLDEGCALA